MILFIDIETIPCQNETLRKYIASKVTHPANIKKQETIDKWDIEKRPEAEEQAIVKTSLDGMYGEIISLSFALDDGEIYSIYRAEEESEAEMLIRFWASIAVISNNEVPIWCGHNICDFDLRFLWHRCVINEVTPSIPIPYDVKPWGKGVIDTLYEFMGINKAGGSLDSICRVLGLEGKGDMTGADVWPEYQKGNILKIAQYNADDVSKCREIYKRINFSKTVNGNEL